MIGLVTGTIIILLIIIGIIGYYIFKKKQKRYEQLFDLIKEMRLSPQEIMTFKEKSDQLLIKPGKLFINYENILGHGSSSTIYKGHISGPSPLHLSTQLIETQTFCDCDVAVKVARNFGSGEVELLYKEIQALKTLGYHENISCMLGWAIPGETPCLVFDIAKMDLLQYVRGFRDAAKEMVPYKDFLSFLWQITRGELVEIYLLYSLGMQYITSKQMIHRDLAARNILLTNNNFRFWTLLHIQRRFLLPSIVGQKTSYQMAQFRSVNRPCLFRKIRCLGIWSFDI